jgi:hypothetical protein
MGRSWCDYGAALLLSTLLSACVTSSTPTPQPLAVTTEYWDTFQVSWPAPGLKPEPVRLLPLSGGNTYNFFGEWPKDGVAQAGVFLQIAYGSTIWRQPSRLLAGTSFARRWARFQQTAIEEVSGERSFDAGTSTIRYVYFNAGELRCVGLRQNLTAQLRGSGVMYVFGDRYYCARDNAIWDEKALRPIATDYRIETVPRPDVKVR